MSENPDMRDFAQRYTAAWCSQDPASVASFFAAEGTLKVNDAEPAKGTAAIVDVARGFMEAFSDLHLRMDALETEGDRYYFHWTLSGTNDGPGGTGKRVQISGYEHWRIGEDGRVAESLGHFDSEEYERQLAHGI